MKVDKARPAKATQPSRLMTHEGMIGLPRPCVKGREPLPGDPGEGQAGLPGHGVHEVGPAHVVEQDGVARLVDRLVHGQRRASGHVVMAYSARRP